MRIGIDLGGTNVKLGLVDAADRIVLESSVPTRIGKILEQIVNDICDQIFRLLRQKSMGMDAVEGIGIGSPGAIDSERGVVLYSNNFFWQEVPLVRMVQERMYVRTFIANDAQCAALGEARAGAGVHCQDLILITLGTGVGSGIIVNGKLFSGGFCGGGVVGHMVIVKDGELCTCGRKGCLEAYASASALIRDTKRAAQAYPDSLLAEKCGIGLQYVTGKTVFDAAKQGDPIAQNLVRRFIENLGEGIANLVNIFRPEKVLISGGVSNQGKSLIKPLNEYIEESCFAGRQLFIPPVECAMLGNKAGIIGAAALVQNTGMNCAE